MNFVPRGSLVRSVDPVSGVPHMSSRRAVEMGEIGVVMGVTKGTPEEFLSNSIIWYDVLFHDGVVEVPEWCIETIS